MSMTEADIEADYIPLAEAVARAYRLEGETDDRTLSLAFTVQDRSGREQVALLQGRVDQLLRRIDHLERLSEISDRARSALIDERDALRIRLRELGASGRERPRPLVAEAVTWSPDD